MIQEVKTNFGALSVRLQRDVRPSSGYNSAVSSLAQSTRLLKSQAVHDKAMSIVKGNDSYTKDWDIVNRAVLELQMLYGLRISEVLSISSGQVNSLGYISIKGKKGSKNRIVRSSLFVPFWVDVVRNGYIIGMERSRFYYYHLYRRYGLCVSLPGSGVNAVTHSLRHIVIQSMKSDSFEIENIAEFIGHKNSKNTENYGK